MSFRFARDHWLSRERTFAKSGPLTFDKLQHFIGGMVAVLLLFPFVSLLWAALGSMLFWFLWEVKDSLLPWEDGHVTHFPIKYNWGGDGFSWRDMLAAWTGALLITGGMTLC